MTASELTDSDEPNLPPDTADAWAVVYLDVEEMMDDAPESNYEGKPSDTSNTIKSFHQKTDHGIRSNDNEER